MKYKCFDCNGDSDDDIMMAIFIMMMVTIFMKIEDACGLGPDLELPPELTRVIVIRIITRNRVDRVPA